MREVLILLVKKIGRLCRSALRFLHSALKNLYNRWGTFLKKRQLNRLKNKLRAEVSRTRNR
jgi:hypothetical protein